MRIASMVTLVLILFPATIYAECDLSKKRVLMVTASKNFNDTEYSVPRDILEKAGVKVVVASSSLGEAEGMAGMKLKPDILINNAKASEYSAIIFVGGSGANEYWKNPSALKLAKEAYGHGEVIAAICIAPTTLANAGLLKGRKVTVWPSQASKLKKLGADVTEKLVEVDGRIVTGKNPKAAKEFANSIKVALCD